MATTIDAVDHQQSQSKAAMGAMTQSHVQSRIEDINITSNTKCYSYKNIDNISTISGDNIEKRDTWFGSYNIYSALIINNNIRLSAKEESLGEGAYGLVIGYTNNDNYGVSVKYGQISEDIEVLEYIKYKNICERSYVKSYVKKNNDKVGDYIVMEYMDGNLNTYFKENFQIDNFFNIIKKIVNHLICFVEKGLYYTDLKLRNILYRCDNENNIIEILLGDLGSFGIVDKENNKIKGSVATYISYNRLKDKDNEKSNLIQNPTEEDIVWSFGIMILEIFANNEKNHTKFKEWVLMFSSGTFLQKGLRDRIMREMPTNIKYLKNTYENKKFNNFINDTLVKILVPFLTDKITLNNIKEKIEQHINQQSINKSQNGSELVKGGTTNSKLYYKYKYYKYKKKCQKLL
jgi:Protein kinase domain